MEDFADELARTRPLVILRLQVRGIQWGVPITVIVLCHLADILRDPEVQAGAPWLVYWCAPRFLLFFFRAPLWLQMLREYGRAWHTTRRSRLTKRLHAVSRSAASVWNAHLMRVYKFWLIVTSIVCVLTFLQRCFGCFEAVAVPKKAKVAVDRLSIHCLICWAACLGQSGVMAVYYVWLLHNETLDRADERILQRHTRLQSAGQADVGEDCVVCLGPLCKGQVLRWLPCGDRFHQKCIDPWICKQLSNREEMRCPRCFQLPLDGLSDDSGD